MDDVAMLLNTPLQSSNPKIEQMIPITATSNQVLRNQNVLVQSQEYDKDAADRMTSEELLIIITSIVKQIRGTRAQLALKYCESLALVLQKEQQDRLSKEETRSCGTSTSERQLHQDLTQHINSSHKSIQTTSKKLPFDQKQVVHLTIEEVLEQQRLHLKSHDKKSKVDTDLYDEELAIRINSLQSEIVAIKSRPLVLKDAEKICQGATAYISRIQDLEDLTEEKSRALEDQEQKISHLMNELQEQKKINDIRDRDLHTLKQNIEKKQSQTEAIRKKYQEQLQQKSRNSTKPGKKQSSQESVQIQSASQESSDLPSPPSPVSSSNPKDLRSILELISEIYLHLGKMYNMIFTKESQQQMSTTLRKDFDDFISHYGLLQDKYDSKCSAYEEVAEGYFTAKTLYAKASTCREEQIALRKSLDYIANLVTSNPSQQNKQTHQQRSYAEMAGTPQLQPSQPKLILSPTGDHHLNDINKVLNKIKPSEVPVVDSIPTKSGKLLLTCKNKTDLDKIKTHLSEAEELNSVAQIREIPPKRRRVLLLGVPKINFQLQQGSSEQNEEDKLKLQSYEQDFLVPALKNSLKKEDISFKIYKVLRGAEEQDKSHIVLDMTENDALTLLATRPIIGFNRVTVKPFVQIMRCFNCQQIGHIQSQCNNPAFCGNCAFKHQTRNCQGQSSHKCVNCHAAWTRGNRSLDYHHAASSTSCPTYKKSLDDAIRLNTRSVNNKVRFLRSRPFR